MNIAFRVDSSVKIGSGHFTRCLAIADYLISKKCNIFFISQNILPNNKKELHERKIIFLKLKKKRIKLKIKENKDLKHSNWLAVTQQEDALETLHSLSKINLNHIIVDHYSLDYRWEKIIYNQIKKIFVIDDLADRKHFCTTLLDQNYYKNMSLRYKGLVDKKTKLLIGTKYCLLKKDILKISKSRNDKIIKDNILIIFSGYDINQYTDKTLDILYKFKFNKFKINVIITNNNFKRKQLIKRSKNENFNLYIQPKNIGILIKNSSLIISPGGIITWEKLYFKVPSIVVATAFNQIKAMSDLHKTNSIIYLGNSLKTYKIKLYKQLKTTLNTHNNFHSLKKKISINIDGKGVKRVYEYLK